MGWCSPDLSAAKSLRKKEFEERKNCGQTKFHQPTRIFQRTPSARSRATKRWQRAEPTVVVGAACSDAIADWFAAASPPGCPSAAIPGAELALIRADLPSLFLSFFGAFFDRSWPLPFGSPSCPDGNASIWQRDQSFLLILGRAFWPTDRPKFKGRRQFFKVPLERMTNTCSPASPKML